MKSLVGILATCLPWTVGGAWVQGGHRSAYRGHHGEGEPSSASTRTITSDANTDLTAEPLLVGATQPPTRSGSPSPRFWSRASSRCRGLAPPCSRNNKKARDARHWPVPAPSSRKRCLREGVFALPGPGHLLASGNLGAAAESDLGPIFGADRRASFALSFLATILAVQHRPETLNVLASDLCISWPPKHSP